MGPDSPSRSSRTLRIGAGEGESGGTDLLFQRAPLALHVGSISPPSWGSWGPVMIGVMNAFLGIAATGFHPTSGGGPRGGGGPHHHGGGALRGHPRGKLIPDTTTFRVAAFLLHRVNWKASPASSRPPWPGGPDMSRRRTEGERPGLPGGDQRHQPVGCGLHPAGDSSCTTAPALQGGWRLELSPGPTLRPVTTQEDPSIRLRCSLDGLHSFHPASPGLERGGLPQLLPAAEWRLRPGPGVHPGGLGGGLGSRRRGHGPPWRLRGAHGHHRRAGPNR